MKKIAQLEGNDSDDSGKEHSQMEQPQTYPTQKAQALSQVPPATAESTEVYVVMEGKENLKGDGGGVDSEEGLDSHTGTKALVPQLTPSKTDARDHHPADKQHPTETPLSELKLPLKLKWRRGKDLPFGMWHYPKVVVFKEKLYIGGGLASSNRKAQTVMVYDPKQDSYDTLPPYTYKWFSMAVVNNQLVLVGGYDVKQTNKLAVWNEQSKSWTHPLPPMTIACNSPSVATHNNRWLVVMGGYDDDHLSRVEILDTTESRQWYHAISLPQPLCGALPATIGNMCYLLGGYTKGPAFSKKVFSVCLDDLISQAVSQPMASTSAPPTPSPWQSLPYTPLYNSTALVFNGALLAVGGESTAIYHYQPSSRSWIKAGELPTE